METHATDLLQAVENELTGDWSVNVSEIAVSVRAGTIVLEGWVDALAQKRSAENAARRAAGTIAVTNALRVRASALDGDPDEDVAAMAFLTLKWDANLPADGIKAYVHDGTVTLRGEVERQFQREAAETAIARLRGVRAIVNDIAIRERVASA